MVGNAWKRLFESINQEFGELYLRGNKNSYYEQIVSRISEYARRRRLHNLASTIFLKLCICVPRCCVTYILKSSTLTSIFTFDKLWQLYDFFLCDRGAD